MILDWKKRSNHQSHKPDWQDKIPHELYSLGKVFFPIPHKRKGHSYPHHLDDYRYEPDSEILNAYLECGWNYGIACDNDLAVVDIDDLDYVEEITEQLPETLHQLSGSRKGYHLFYLCEGLENRLTLKDGNKHIGEVKANPHGYVVGPGSVHPSGNIYGPLEGDEIVTIEKELIEEVLDDYISSNEEAIYYEGSIGGEGGHYVSSDNEFYNLTADDVIPWLEPERRIAHPIHGSSTGTNFMKNKDRETFTCWRCQIGAGDGCGVNAQQYLCMEDMDGRLGDHACEEVRRKWQNDSTLHYYAWRRAYERDLVSADDIPYTVIKGYAVDNNVMNENETLNGDLYYDMLNALRYISLYAGIE